MEEEHGKMIRKLLLLAACLVFVGLMATGCDQTSRNMSELTDYGRGIFLDGSDVRSFAR